VQDIFAPLVTARIARTHDWLLSATDELSQAELGWRAGPRAPAIGFHVWHVARWADRLQARLPGMLGSGAGHEVWDTENFAERWLSGSDGLLGSDRLGFGATGMGMDEDASTQIPLAGKEVLLAYSRAAFAACDQAVAPLTDTDFGRVCRNLMYDRDEDATVGQLVLMHLGHAGRHQGMIEALRGVMSDRDSAT
jgi:hypothetical protein